MKKIFSILLAMVMTVGIVFYPMEVKAEAKELTAGEVADYFNSKVGNTVPEASCLAFVANSFEALGAKRSSACCAYRYGTEHIVSTSKDNIPIGADVFLNWGSDYSYKKYICPTCGDYCHHIGVYIGDGNIVHTSGGTVVVTSLDTLLNSWNMEFRGWGYHGNVTIDGESGEQSSGSVNTTEEVEYIYFGHQTMSWYYVKNSAEVLESNENGIYELNGDYYRVVDGDVYATIPIKWRVLEDNGDTLLLLQEHVYTGSSWEDDLNANNLTWESSNIKSYLNGNYCNNRFTEEEKQDIVGLENNKIYLPSVDELEYYLPTVESRKAHYFTDSVPNVTTPIVGFGEGNAYNRAEYTCAYWTRTASKYSYSWAQPSYVTCDGYITSGGRMYYTWSAGVRPMMRIKKDSQNYYRAPKNIEFSMEEQIVVYEGEKFNISVNRVGEGITEQYHPYTVWLCYNGVSKEDEFFVANRGKRKILYRIYGIEPNVIELQTTVIVKPAIEKITVEGIKTFRTYMNISWTNSNASECYEIVRSTSKEGPYETIYEGATKSYGEGIVREENNFYYRDTTAEENQQYWYKVRGLFGTSGEHYDTLEGYEAEFSDPVSGIIEASVTHGWVVENGKSYWYENGIKQGTEGRGKEIYDSASDAWYWLDAVQDGAKAISKDVYQESFSAYPDRPDGTGKWVRYDENGHMVKGWQTTDAGTYYFETVTGAMAKGNVTIDGQSYYFNEATGILEQQTNFPDGWNNINGVAYWYENGIRQGYNPNDPSYRGKEIYDSGSDAWYWLDNVQQGAKATGKDVYQESYSAYPDRPDGTGKWVRYDENGHMIKGWQITDSGIYYFEPVTGAMAKGSITIDGVNYYFDVNTGILQ